jgi:signal transduction histidine kinase
MGVMVVQAGGARAVLETDPVEARHALRRVEETGREGLAEMRRLIGILSPEAGDAALAPQPGLARVDELAETIRQAGLPVEIVVEGGARALPAGADLAAYRVVQESLTNSLRHAGKARASVRLRYENDALDVEIADDGRGPPPDGELVDGHGLLGMRERVALFGGSFQTFARPGGGFVVRARFPLPP